MLKGAVKFCGGCNPGYDRGEAYRRIREALADTVSFSLPQPEAHYDVLLILRGCTGCPYLYEEIDAEARVICVRKDEIEETIQTLRRMADPTEKDSI